MSNRTVLLSIDYEAAFDRFGDYAPGQWQTTMSMSLEDRAASFWEAMGGTWSDGLAVDPVIVGGVKDRHHYYPEVFDIDELFLVDTGFYYDQDAQICYIKFKDSAPWYTAELLDYGQALRFIDAAQFDPVTGLSNQAHIDGIYVEPRLVPESFSYRQTVAPIDDNRMSFDDCSITLINADGFLDNIREQIIGRTMRAYFSSLPDMEVADSLSDFDQAFGGIVKSVKFAGGKTVTITGGDMRASWTGEISSENLTLAEFPDMAPDLESQHKNIIIGQVYRAPGINVSAEGDNRTWSMNSVINGQATMQALYDGDPDEFTPINPSQYTYTPATGVLVLNKELKGDLRADMLGDPITSPVTGLESLKAVDVALVALQSFVNLPYIDSFWDKNDINVIYARSPDVGVFIGSKGIVLKDFIDDVLSSANTRIYLKSIKDATGVSRDKLSMRDITVSGFGITAALNPNDMISLPLPWGYDEKSHMSSIAVEYNPRIYDEVFRVYRDDSLFDKAYENTPVISEYNYRSHCTDLNDIAALAIQRYATGTLAAYRIKGASATELNFTLLDYVIYTHTRSGGERILNPAIWRVTEIDVINRTFELTFISYFTSEEREMQIGEITWWPGAGAIPETKLLCNGALYDPADYPDLFTVLGVTWGGDGATTFGVPNLEGIFPGAVGTQDIGGNTKGDPTAVIGAYAEDQLQGHFHNFSARQQTADGSGDSRITFTGAYSENDFMNAVISNKDRYASDDTNGEPRTGDHTDVSRAMGQWIIQA